MNDPKKCSVLCCYKPAVGAFRTATSRRFKVWFCDEHKPADIIEPFEFKPTTTGEPEFDRDINQAVDSAMLRINPILRDIIREELRRCLQCETENDVAS